MDMVERVAKAICEERAEPWDNLNDDERRSWRETARAAIEALREPTSEMWRAGEDVLNRRPFASTPKVWQTFIDAALASPAAPESSSPEPHLSQD